MTIKIIGLIIGILVLGTGVYYLAKEQHAPGIQEDLHRHQRDRRCDHRSVRRNALALLRTAGFHCTFKQKKLRVSATKLKHAVPCRIGGTVRGDLLPAVPNISAHISRF